jgi:hypothetical protein
MTAFNQSTYGQARYSSGPDGSDKCRTVIRQDPARTVTFRQLQQKRPYDGRNYGLREKWVIEYGFTFSLEYGLVSN